MTGIRNMTRVAQLLALVLATGLSVILSSVADEPKVRVRAAWIREAPPVSTMLAGYLTIENDTENAIAVVGARSPTFARVEIHRTEMRNGMARMSRQDRVVIAPNGTQQFEPGGYHLMLIKPLNMLKRGDLVELELLLEDGQFVEVELIVRKSEP